MASSEALGLQATGTVLWGSSVSLSCHNEAIRCPSATFECARLIIFSDMQLLISRTMGWNSLTKSVNELHFKEGSVSSEGRLEGLLCCDLSGM